MATPVYTSFSGIDLVAIVNNVVVGTLQGVSYSVTREKAPIYTFGSANPRSFSRGKRGIAGSLIFTLFDRSALAEVMVSEESKYYKRGSEPYALSVLDQDPWTGTTATTTGATSAPTFGDTPTGDPSAFITTQKARAEYMDQIMPMNITLIANNEYGYNAWKTIIGVEILNEGGGLSVDDITNEEQATFVARAATGWTPYTGNITDGTGKYGPTGATSADAALLESLKTNYTSWLDAGAKTTFTTV